jgi:hypothetical protein
MLLPVPRLMVSEMLSKRGRAVHSSPLKNQPRPKFVTVCVKPLMGFKLQEVVNK